MKTLLTRPYSLWIQPTRRTNLDSVLSYDPPESEQSGEELEYAELIDLMDEAFENGVVSLFLEGGEPFLRPDFLDVVKYACANAFTIVRSNGTLIDDETARQLKIAGVGVACVDLFGALPETHDALTRTAGSFKRTVGGIRSLVASGVPTYITCIMNRLNVDELQDVLDFSAELGVEKVSILRLYALGRARTHWDELSLPLATQVAALSDLRVPDGIVLMQSWHPKDPNCCWQTAAVDAYGNSIGCPYLRDFVNYGNVREKSFMETWNHPLYVSIRGTGMEQIDGSCPDCSASEHSAGGCRSSAYTFTGRWDTLDPHCENMNNGVDLTVLPEHMQVLPPGPRPESPVPVV